MKKRKKSYLLLELLICFSLVSICALPIIYRPLQISKACLKAQEKGEWIRQADLILADFKEELFTGNFSWEELPQSKGKKVSRKVLPSLFLQPSFGGNKKIQVERVIECRSKERLYNEQDARILIFRLTFHPLFHSVKEVSKKKFTYFEDGEEQSEVRDLNVFEYKFVVYKKILQNSIPEA